VTEQEQRERVRQTLSLLMDLDPEVRTMIADVLGFTFIARGQYVEGAQFRMLYLGQTPSFLNQIELTPTPA
jgi:hypothetical protein